jgi:hypothetical protein
MRAIAGCLPLLFCALTLGCQRKLPGPQECRAFALASLGVEPETSAVALSRQLELTARAEELTRQCLTTPWDYPLLDCLAQGHSSRACLVSFQARRQGTASQLNPAWR